MSNYVRALVLAAVAVPFLAVGVRSEPGQAAPTVIFELRIDTAAPGRLADLQTLYREQAGSRARHRIAPLFAGTVLEGAASDGDRAPQMLIEIVTHSSRAAADASWKNLGADPAWMAAWSAAEKTGPLLAGAPVSTFMTPTDFSPALTAAGNGSPRVFELRKYNTGADGLDYTVDRFKLGLAKVIADSGMTPIAFWTADDRSAFVYLVAHQDREAARASWSNFMPGYREFMTKYTADHAGAAPPSRTPEDNRFLTPTDYSPIK